MSEVDVSPSNGSGTSAHDARSDVEAVSEA